MNELSRRFRNYRISLNKTQNDIANECNISVLTVEKFENGKDIKISTLEKLLTAIGYPDVLDNIIYDINNSPSFIVSKKNKRKRVKKSKIKPKKFIWGEDK